MTLRRRYACIQFLYRSRFGSRTQSHALRCFIWHTLSEECCIFCATASSAAAAVAADTTSVDDELFFHNTTEYTPDNTCTIHHMNAPHIS